jgi:hypothetical protein
MIDAARYLAEKGSALLQQIEQWRSVDGRGHIAESWKEVR